MHWTRKALDKTYDISKELSEVAATDATNEELEEICSTIVTFFMKVARLLYF